MCIWKQNTSEHTEVGSDELHTLSAEQLMELIEKYPARYCTPKALKYLKKRDPDWIETISGEALEHILALIIKEELSVRFIKDKESTMYNYCALYKPTDICDTLIDAYRKGIHKELIRKYAGSIKYSAVSSVSYETDSHLTSHFGNTTYLIEVL